MSDDNQMPTATDVDALVDAIRPLLAGKDPSLQGAALADLLAIYLGGYPDPVMREEIFAMHIDAVRELIPVNQDIFWPRP